MEFQDYAKFALALVLVLGLLAMLAWVLRRSGFGTGTSKGRRLAVAEALMVGPRHRLLLIRRDDTEHLLLLGPTTQIAVESGIRRPEAAPGSAAPSFATTSFATMVEAAHGTAEGARS